MAPTLSALLEEAATAIEAAAVSISAAQAATLRIGEVAVPESTSEVAREVESAGIRRDDAAWIPVLLDFDVRPADGLDRAAASAVLQRHGIKPRDFKLLVRWGLVTRVGDRRWLTDAGRTSLAGWGIAVPALR